MNNELTIEQSLVLYAVAKNIKRLEELAAKMEARAELYLSWYHNSIKKTEAKTLTLKTYRVSSFSGYYLGGYAVIVAETPEQALELLKVELDSRMLLEKNCYLKVEDMVEVNTSVPMVDILSDGDY